MTKSTDVRIVEANCSFVAVPFRAPLKFGGRIVESSFLTNVELTVETRAGQHASGFGSMPVGNVWAWPSNTLSPEQTEQAMKKFSEEVMELANAFPEYGHPIDITYQISAKVTEADRRSEGKRTFDRIQFCFEVAEPGGDLAARCTVTWTYGRSTL